MSRIREQVKERYNSDLAWFDLNKYDQCKLRALDYYGWLLQIAYRRDVLHLAQRWHRTSPACNELEEAADITLGKELHELFTIVKQDPIVTAHSLSSLGLRHYQPRTFLDVLNYDAESNMTIRPASIFEYYLHQFDLQESVFRYAHGFFSGGADLEAWRNSEISYEQLATRTQDAYLDRWDNEHNWGVLSNEDFNDARPTFDRLLNDSMCKYTVDESKVFLILDQSAPDKQIMDDLEKLLQRFKTRKKIVKKKKLDLYSWVYNGLLPYMDLQVWATLRDIGDVPDWVAQRALYMGHEKKHTINAVTRRLSSSLLARNSDSWKLLRAKAADEIRRQRIAQKVIKSAPNS